MDNFQFWLYVIIAVIYVLSRFRKKPNEKPANDIPEYTPERPNRRIESTTSQTPQARPMSFEDLLREITESKQPSKPVVPQTYESEQPKYVDYDDEIKEEIEDLEEVDYDYRKKDTIYSTYEDAKSQAFLRPSLEETWQREDEPSKFGRFKIFEEDKKAGILDDYVREFQDPGGLKKAVIMSEILKTKF